MRFNFFIFLSLLPLLLFPQEKFVVSGTISDAATGETLIGATILVNELPNTGVSCNAYGYYSLTLPPGRFTLVASFIGYESFVQPVEVDGNKTVNMKLSTENNEIGEVVVLADRKNENIVSHKIGVEKVDMKSIEKIPVLFGERDVLKTLTLTPGVKTLGDGGSGLYVRGGNNSQNLILLDEATIYNANHLMGFFSTFNSDAIKDLTLFKGTAPAEYGGRIASVLDIKMIDGNNRDFHAGGGIGLISSRLNAEGPLVKEKGSFLITGRRTYADLALKFSSDTALKNNRLYFYDLNAKINYRFDDKNRIYLSGYLGRDVIGVNDRFKIDWGNVSGTFRWNHVWNSKLFSNTSLVYSDYDYEIEFQMNDNRFSLTSVIKNINLKQDFQYFINNRNNLVFGLNSLYHSITPGQLELVSLSNLLTVKLQNRHAIENSIFISNNWKPSPKWNINYGIRLTSFMLAGPGDFYTYLDGEVTDTMTFRENEVVKSYLNAEPRINASFIIDQKNSVKAGYTRNVQNLHLISNSTSSTPIDIWVASGINVKPEIGDQVTAGYFRNFDDDRFQFSAEVYYKWMKNQPDLRNGAEITANEHIEGELLFGDARAYGLELLLKKKYGNLSGWLGYTLSRTERLIDGINNNKWYPARQDATHDVSVVGIYDLNGKWSLSGTWVYNTGNAVTFPSGKYRINGEINYYYTERNGYRMPAYHRLDLGATRYFKKSKKFESSLNFSVYNAYGRKNAYSIDFEEDPDNSQKTVAVKTYLFTFMPSITYNFRF